MADAPWSADDEQELAGLVHVFGTQWKVIERVVAKRTRDAIRRHWWKMRRRDLPICEFDGWLHTIDVTRPPPLFKCELPARISFRFKARPMMTPPTPARVHRIRIRVVNS